MFLNVCKGSLAEVAHQLKLVSSEDDTVDVLKERIKACEGTPASQQVLYFDNKPLDEGDRLLSTYNINERSTIFMLRPSSRVITVKTLRGEHFELDVEQKDTIGDVKTRLEEQMGTAPELQLLIFKPHDRGQELDNESLLTDIIGAEPPADGSATVIYLVPRLVKQTIKIIVKTLAGRVIPLEVDQKDTIDAVKLKIEESESLPAEAQRLIFQGKQLDGAKTVSEFNIAADSVLHLVMRSGRPTTEVTPSRYDPVAGSCDTVGACGLFNLGNTCFMNSILQALSNTVALRSYYRSGDFKSDISDAPLGMKGRLANAFADLLTRMWGDSHTVLSPSELKQLIAEKRPEFAGCQQHDAQEVLTFLLDGLHEDVNRAPYPRPIVEDPSIDGKTDMQVAKEAWNGNLRRNDSRVVDIFQFQIRSEITFPEAKDKSLKFDPMMYLSLPVPKPPHRINVTVTRHDYPQADPIKRCFEIPKDKTFGDLERLMFRDLTNEPAEGVVRRDLTFLFVNMSAKRPLNTFLHSQRVSDARPYDTVWAFAVPFIPGVPKDEHEFIPVHMRKRAGAGSSASSSTASFQCFAPPLILAMRRRERGSESSPSRSGPGLLSIAEVVKRLRTYITRLETRFGIEEGAFKHSITWVPPYSNAEGTPIDTEGMFELQKPQATLAVNLLNFDKVMQDRTLDLPEVRAARRPDDSDLREVDLEQCLDTFTQVEELAQDDWVKSSKTGKFERSRKKLDIWTAPTCLLVHLKRFGSERLGGPIEKVDTYVKAPHELDLTPWLQGPPIDGGARYKLYAVVNHSGSLSFGHYTAYCRVGESANRPWYHFNDSNVSRASDAEVVSRAAYILFYERVGAASSAAHGKAPL